MEISIKTSTLFVAILLTGLSAGLFYAWTVSVIPGTRRVIDISYIETMQSINRAILNPAFFLIFFGSLLFLIVSAYQHYQPPMSLSFWLILGATLSYLIGTFGVTLFGNVPMNEVLDKIKLSELSLDQLIDTRQSFEVRWNRLHMIRTVFSVLAFVASLLAAFFQQSTSTH